MASRWLFELLCSWDGKTRCAQARSRDFRRDPDSCGTAGAGGRESRSSDSSARILESMHLQLAGDVPGGWLGCAQGETDSGAAAQARSPESAMGLPRGDGQEPATAGLPVRAVDARDDRQTDCQALWVRLSLVSVGRLLAQL